MNARIAGDLLLAVVLVAVGLLIELVMPDSRAVGFGLIFGGWAALVVFAVRSYRVTRSRV